MKNINFKTAAHSQSSAKKKNDEGMTRECNICEKPFQARSSMTRFCRRCRVESEVYRMAEWFPVTDVTIGY